MPVCPNLVQESAYHTRFVGALREGLVSPETTIEGSPAYDGPKIGYMKTVVKSGLLDLKTRERERVRERFPVSFL